MNLDGMEIRNFQAADMPQLGELYGAVSARENVVFWWVGDEENWDNALCAYADGKMVAKGQLEVVNIVPSGRSTDNKHHIYLNLKALPEWEEEYALLDQVYERLLVRAKELNAALPQEYATLLCTGNDSQEAAVNRYFKEHLGFHPYRSVFSMDRDLNEPIHPYMLEEGLEFAHWQMETAAMEEEYLQLEYEVWPDAALGRERLHQYMNNPLWTALVVRDAGNVAASAMAWKNGAEEETAESGRGDGQEQVRAGGTGVIEDVFVREPWRKRGIARYLLVQALSYLKEQRLSTAQLYVLTTNANALSLYTSVGFKVVTEEIRCCIDFPG